MRNLEPDIYACSRELEIETKALNDNATTIEKLQASVVQCELHSTLYWPCAFFFPKTRSYKYLWKLSRQYWHIKLDLFWSRGCPQSKNIHIECSCNVQGTCFVECEVHSHKPQSCCFLPTVNIEKQDGTMSAKLKSKIKQEEELMNNLHQKLQKLKVMCLSF